MTPLLTINQAPTDKTSIQLDEVEGEVLRSIILMESGLSWNAYLSRINQSPTNVINYLSGYNRISIAVLQRLISGCQNLHLQCTLTVQVLKQNGNSAEDVDSTQLDEMSYLTGGEHASVDEYEQAVLRSVAQANSLPSSLLGKPPENKKMQLENPSGDHQGEYLTPCSPTPPILSTSVSPTQLPVDQPSSTLEDNQSTENPQKQNENSVNQDSTNSSNPTTSLGSYT